MRRRLTVILATLGLSLVLVSTAAAAPALSVTEIQRTPEVIHRGDQIVGYNVKLRNTGTTVTEASPPTTVSVSLPAGLELAYTSGSKWSCSLSTQTCTFSPQTEDQILPGADFPQLRFQAWIRPDQAPDTITTSFDVSGGGSAPTTAQDSFLQAPQRVFEVLNFTARAESQGGADYTEAGGHPYSATTTFSIPTYKTALNQDSVDGREAPVEHLRDAYFELPAGFIGNPESVRGICTVAQVSGSKCPGSAAVGGVEIELAGQGSFEVAFYRVFPERGYPAAFAFRPVPVSGLTVLLRAKLRASGDYGITASSPLPPQIPAAIGARFATLCSYGAKTTSANFFGGCREPGEQGSNAIPLLTNPTRCAGPAPVTIAHLDSFQSPARQNAEGLPDLSDPNWKSAEFASPPTDGCNQLEFEPTFEGRPTTSVADAPSGLDFKLHIPQDGLLDRNGRAPAHLRDSTVTLPEGMVVNPAAAAGLDACSSAQIGMITPVGAAQPHFTGLPDNCPDAAKIGSVEISTPVLGKPLKGSVFLARQFDNPFGSLLALYISIDDPETGILAKLPGKVTPDPRTGRLTATFADNPQVPFEDLTLHVFEGARASLRTPATCGAKATTATFTPWSAPESGPPVTRSDSFAITTAPGGGGCPTTQAQLPSAPRLTAGTVTPKAGAYSPFVLRLARDDGSQEINRLDATLPPGLTGRLAGVPYCPEAAIARAIARSKPGQGASESSDPSCPAASQVGTVDVAAGAGPLPYHAAGKAYLAGPYKGAPVSLIVVTPAVAGPFDLGAVVVRNALYVDPVSAQVTVKSDPIPTIIEGIPLDVRSIEVSVSRAGFTLNPTSCEPSQVAVTVGAASSQSALSQRFQVGECSALGFKPKLSLRLKGGTKRGDYPALTAVLTQRPGDANLAGASVALPHSEFLEQAHIRTICTRVQFAAKACPPGSIYGYAEATTPLLDEPVKGPVYLRSSSNPLPDLVVVLRGPDSQPIEVNVAGRVDSVNGGIRNSFEVLPDAPVTKFVLRMQGGKKGLLVNSRDLCKSKAQRATARLVAQNGKRSEASPVMGIRCSKKSKGKKAKGGKERRSLTGFAWRLRAW